MTKQNELKNQLARALADYDNLRKRSEAEKQVWTKFAATEVLVRLLPVLDTLESALVQLKDQGLYLAISDFKKVLADEGLVEIRPKVGEEFNHELQEAVELIVGGKKNTIAAVLLPGWKYTDGQVLRHAKVKVFGIMKE